MYGFSTKSAGMILFHRYFYDNNENGHLSRFNYSFDGPRFFSYYTVIGLTVPGLDGSPVLLYSFHSMSNTTGGHISALVRACPFEDSHKIPVPFQRGDHYISDAASVSRLFADWFSDFDEKRLKYADARRELSSMTTAARRFSELVKKLPARVLKKADRLFGIAAAADEKLRLRREAAANRTPEECARLAAARAARIERAQLRLSEKVRQFENLPYLERVRLAFDRRSGLDRETAAALRSSLDIWGGCSFVELDRKSGEIVTTQGVRMDFETVRRLLKLWISGAVRVGMHAGPYTVRAIFGDVVQIGCHKIPVENLRALAAALLPSGSEVAAVND